MQKIIALKLLIGNLKKKGGILGRQRQGAGLPPAPAAMCTHANTGLKRRSPQLVSTRIRVGDSR
jgi:hypothetical protein